MTPSASYCLFTYRQVAWAAEALASALAQDAEGLEIRVYDDGSDDGTYELLEERIASYGGPHRVVLSTSRDHVGLAAQLGRAARESSGALLVVAAGDDVARPDRVQSLVAAFESGVSALHSNATVIDAQGVPHGLWMASPPLTPSSWREVVEGRWQLFGATAAYDRALLLAHGGLHPDVAAEDLALSLRAVRAGRVVFIDEPLVAYRRHDRNVSMASDGLDDPGRYRRHLAHRARFLEGAHRQWAHDLRAMRRDAEDDVWAETCDRRAMLWQLTAQSSERRLSATDLLTLARCIRRSEWKYALRTLALGTAPSLVDALRRWRR